MKNAKGSAGSKAEEEEKSRSVSYQMLGLKTMQLERRGTDLLQASSKAVTT